MLLRQTHSLSSSTWKRRAKGYLRSFQEAEENQVLKDMSVRYAARRQRRTDKVHASPFVFVADLNVKDVTAHNVPGVYVFMYRVYCFVV